MKRKAVVFILAAFLTAIAAPAFADDAVTVYSYNFEAGWGSWWSDYGIWDVGEPNSGPYSAYSGTQCAATNLNANYSYGPDSRLAGPQVVLPTITAGEEILLRFRQWWSYSSSDRGYVQIQTYDEPNAIWSNWVDLKEVYSYDSTWHHALVDLKGYSGQRVRIGFYHKDQTETNSYGSNIHSESSGWYIDDVEIIRQAIPLFDGFEDFELGWDDWWCDRGIWELGVPTTGPDEAYSGTECMATKLDENYPYGPDSLLISPQVILPTITADEEILLRFRQWWSYSSSDKGYVQIQYFDDVAAEWTDWETLKEVYSYDSTWHQALVDLTGYSGQRVRIGFYHTDSTETNSYGSNIHSESLGWYIDDVEIIKQTIPLFDGFEDFELGWDGWWCDRGIWELGTPTTGPVEAYSGTECMATKLDENYPYGPDSRLASPQVILPTVAAGEEILLRFRQWWSYSSSDKGYVQIQKYDEPNGLWSDWTTLYTIQSNNTNWHHARVDLTAYSGQRVRIGFYHTDQTETNSYGSNIHSESLGWYIDDVEITGIATDGPVLNSWFLSEDSGESTNDELTYDDTPELTFVFSKNVFGNTSNIEITDPCSALVVPDSISGWGTSTVVATFTTALTVDGTYTIKLKSSIADSEGKYLNDGAAQIVYFVLDTTPPVVTVDTLTTSNKKPALTGTLSENVSYVDVTAAGNIYYSVDVTGLVWTLTQGTIDPELAFGTYDVIAIAEDKAGNLGIDATLNELVIATNAPDANDDDATTSENMLVDIDVLANDTDIDGDVLLVDSVTQPANGTAIINPDYTVTYTPVTDFYGIDTFAYTVSDRNGGTDTATVTVLVYKDCDIDIYPNRTPNEVDLNNNSTIYVAVIGAADFDVTDVNSSTIRFGRTGTEAAPVRDLLIRDLNGDGINDAMYGFMTFDCGFQPGDTNGILIGETKAEVMIKGEDSVSVSK